MTRVLLVIALSAFVSACGDDTANANVTPNSTMIDAGSTDGGSPTRAEAVRTRDGSVVYWSLRPELETGTVVDLSLRGEENFQLGSSFFWYDDVENGIYFGSDAELRADPAPEDFRDGLFSVDFWWKPASDRAEVRVLRFGSADEPFLTLRLEEMRRWVAVIDTGSEDPVSESWEVDQDAMTAPMHVTVTLDRWGTLRFYSFGILERGIVLPLGFEFPAETTVIFGDNQDDGPDGTLHTAAIYNRTLTNVEAWEHSRVGPFPTESDEVEISPARWINFAANGLTTDLGESFDSAFLEDDEPDRHYGNVDRVRLDSGNSVLLRWWFDRVQTAGPVLRHDVRAWASVVADDAPRSLELSPIAREWIPAAATWNSTGLIDWETPGARARPEDRYRERFTATVDRVGPVWIPLPERLWQDWKDSSESNYGVTMRSESDRSVEVCFRSCGRAAQFIGAIVGTNENPTTEVLRPPDVTFRALGDGGLEIFAETDFCGDPADDVPPCVVEVYARGRFIGRDIDGTIVDSRWEPGKDDTFRIYAFDSSLQPSEPFDGAP